MNISNESITFSEAYEMIGTVDDEDIQEYNQLIKINLNTHSKQNVLDTIKMLEQREDVLIAQPNYYYEQCAIPNDTYISNQTDVIDLLDLEEAWDITTGSSDVKVGVMDSGIKRAHSDLTANVNSTISYAYALNDPKPFIDNDGHGTMVAGVIGAVGNNSRGITGVCWDVDIVSLKVVDSDNEFSTSAIYNAFEYSNINNVNIVNCSFGSYDLSEFDPDGIIYNAIKEFNGLVVCAAGNDGTNNDNTPHYPSNYNLDNIISVANTDNSDVLITKSNYGEASVDLAAPGVDIYTTNISEDSAYYYDVFSGTSASAPFVSGVAALIKSIYPTMTANGVKKAILDGVDTCSSLSGKVKTGGRLNAYKAIKSAQEHKFTVVYDKNGGTGTTMSSTTVTYGVPTRLSANTYTNSTAYTSFAGWYAHRKSDNKWLYTNGSSSGWYVEGTQPSGYEKSLYNDQATISATTYTKNDVVTMYAQWRPYQYQIAYKNNGGSGTMNSQTVAYNTYVNLSSNIIAKKGYKFKGWIAKRRSDSKVYYTDGNVCAWFIDGGQPDGYEKYLFSDREAVIGLSMVDNDIVNMYAQWMPLTYTIEFDKNGGKGTMDSIVSDSSQTITLPTNNFKHTGYCFYGWTLVDEDEFWYYTDGSDYIWIMEGNQPDGYEKVKYENKAEFSYLADYEGITLTLVAQWIPTYAITLGDVNLDGVVSIDDATYIQKYLVGSVELNDVQFYTADINKDGMVNVTDVTELQKML